MRKLAMSELGRLSVQAFKETEKTPLIIILEDVRSALNVGSVFRTADAFALQRILLIGITATPPHREILKTALGSTDSVAWEHFEDIETAFKSLQKVPHTGGGLPTAQQIKMYAVEQVEQSISLENLPIEPDTTYALIFGNEVDGVSENALALADGVVEVPQFGTKHSLNVAVTVGIVSWELTKRIRIQS